MNLLITPAQVAQMAFRAPDFISPDAVSEATIVAAEQKFILPAVGPRMYERLGAGAHAPLLDEYIRPALALYVKLLMLPTLAVQTGAGGVVELNSKNLARATDSKTAAARRRLRSEARALMQRAADAIAASPAAYPDYAPVRIASTVGGIVI